jgi:hypothetical protein
MNTRRIVLVGVLTAVAAAVAFYLYERRQAELRVATQSRLMAAAAEQQRKTAERLRQPQADWGTQIPQAYPRPVSIWRSTEKAFYEQLLSRGSFDVLVVPFQVQNFAVDRASRSLMAAQLALAIAASEKARVPDPYLVAVRWARANAACRRARSTAWPTGSACAGSSGDSSGISRAT